MRRFDPHAPRFSARTLSAHAAAALPAYLAVRAAFRSQDGADAPAEILLYDEIGFWGITAKDFLQALAQAGDGPINLRINSPGGDVFDGLAIFNSLLAHPAPVTVTVDGLAASAASFIAMAGSKIIMAEQSMLMIHDAWGLCMGNRHDMTGMAGVLGKIDGQLAAIYAGKSGKPVADFAAMMDAETWMTAAEAKESGLCDEVRAVVKPDTKAAARIGSPAARERRSPENAATVSEWIVGADDGLPIDGKAAWDGPAAAERMLDAAGFNGESPDPAQARRGFLVYDHHNPKLKGSYKLPFADLIDGKLTAIEAGIDAAASRLPDTDIPADVKAKARAVIDSYEKRAAPDMSESAGNSASLAHAVHESRGRRLRLAAADNA